MIQMNEHLFFEEDLELLSIKEQPQSPLVSQEAFVFVAYSLLAAAACASATFTYVARACWAHLDATGHAKWCV